LLDRITPLQIAMHAATHRRRGHHRRQRRDRAPSRTRNVSVGAGRALGERCRERLRRHERCTGAGGAIDANVGVGGIIGASAGASGTSAGLDGVAATGAHTP
jgi:hypothetical protein